MEPPDHDAPGVRPQAGRGAVRNVRGRFDAHEVVAFDDGWGSLDESAPRLRTVTTPETTREIIATNDSPDIPFDRSVNPYKGCEHGCIYCFARPTHAYLNLSPGLDFETRIVTKPLAPALLRRALSRRGYRPETLALGSNTDPYQPIEREQRITRGVLEVLCEFRHPFSIVTKSNLILRDLDLIAPMARAGRARAFISVTTLDRTLARRMEPRAPTPGRRIETIAALAREGVPVGVLASPMIPGLNDVDLERILESAAAAGARTAGWLLLRLPHEVRELFVEWLEVHYPARRDKVLGLLRDMRGGGLNDPRFGHRMRGSGAYAELLRRRFEVTCRRLGLDGDVPALDASAFRAPGGQATLFS